MMSTQAGSWICRRMVEACQDQFGCGPGQNHRPREPSAAQYVHVASRRWLASTPRPLPGACWRATRPQPIRLQVLVFIGAHLPGLLQVSREGLDEFVGGHILHGLGAGTALLNDLRHIVEPEWWTLKLERGGPGALPASHTHCNLSRLAAGVYSFHLLMAPSRAFGMELTLGRTHRACQVHVVLYGCKHHKTPHHIHIGNI